MGNENEIKKELQALRASVRQYRDTVEALIDEVDEVYERLCAISDMISN